MAMQSGPQSEDSSRQVQSKTEQTPKPDKQDTVVNQLGEEDTVRELSLAGPSHTPNTLNVAFWKLYLTQAGE
ncbi:MAG: hypothetical protein KDD62_13695, partial [Bdellovibrionales bacterium]|nr:hypothetical protein [Bdellovibrionales bacterium]